MSGYARVDPAAFLSEDRRLHALLDGVPLHDVWRIDLPGGPDGLDLRDLRALMASEDVLASNLAVRALFALRRGLGRWFRWDEDENADEGRPGSAAPPPPSPGSWLERLTEEDRAASLEPPGSKEGPFTVLYVFPDEALSEIRNATVHAFSAMTLSRVPGGYEAHWAIYVKPVGRITALYMALIDPFRHAIVYPAMLRAVRRRWRERFGEPERA